jgi:hypothetical protein
MNVREEFKEAVFEMFNINSESPEFRRKHIEKVTADWIERNSYEFVMFKLGFIKGEEQGSTK